MTLFSGCTDAGSLAHRDDGKLAADMLAVSSNPSFNYNNRLAAETERLMREDPKLTREQAVAQARSKVDVQEALVSNTAASSDELARQRRMKAQDKFEDDLAKSMKSDR